MNLNKAFIVGRLTQEPQLRNTPTGQAVCSFSVATNRIWTDKSGARQDETEYHNVVVWGRQAEIASQFLNKGSMVMVEGRLRTRTWQNQQGQNMRTTEIICEKMQFGPKSAGGGGNYQKDDFQKQAQPAMANDDLKDELPEINIDDEGITAEDLPF